MFRRFSIYSRDRGDQPMHYFSVNGIFFVLTFQRQISAYDALATAIYSRDRAQLLTRTGASCALVYLVI